LILPITNVDVIGDVIGDVMWSRNRLYILLAITMFFIVIRFVIVHMLNLEG